MYFPYQKGRYEVAAGLLPLSKDFGNGPWDQLLVQIGEDFPIFRAQFEENRSKEAVNKYVCEARGADQSAIGEVAVFIAETLAKDYPSQISFEGSVFQSSFTGETLLFDATTNSVMTKIGNIQYESAWDAVGAQIPDDIAIWKLQDDGSEIIETLHLNSPNHWAALDKVGKSFAAVHQPVAHIEKIVPYAVNLLEGILAKGPFVRFAWGVGTDDRLNHHPVPPKGVDPVAWAGRRFDPENPKLYARVERQVLWGFPKLNRALFTIRTYFQDVSELKKTHPEAVKGLSEAILSMSPQSLIYKGLTADRDAIVQWLQTTHS
jgi:hypothetical protein